VDTFGLRKTAHVYGTVTLEKVPDFTYRFAEVFNGETFLVYLKQLITKYAGTKLFLIIDNGPAHNLPDHGKVWLRENRHNIELHRLPPYSPEFNPMEGVWKTTRRLTTHNRFYATTAARDGALRGTFKRFRDRPLLVAGHVRRFQ
jgi:transposase